MTRGHRHGPWVAEEDATLLSLVASRGPNNWVQISQHMHFRSPKQCRERYHQNLKASLSRDPISAEEGRLIEQMVAEMGKKWAEIARRLGNRSDNAVKNWWNGSQNRRKRNVPHHGPLSKTLTNRTQPLSALRPPRSPAPQNHRHPNYDDAPARCDEAWQDLRPAHAGTRSLRSQQGYPVDRANSPGRSQRYPHSVQQSQENAHRSEQAPEHRLPGVNRSAPDDHIAHLLPSLGPINTNQLPQSSSSHALQPPHSATSVERPPSLVSDHNSTYSISPKTWPSPRPEVPARLVTSRYHWHESSHVDRRGSAPAISHLVSLPFTGDEGYVSAAPPSASSEAKYLLPTPVGRPTSFDGQYTNIHRHSASNPNISLSPMIGPNRKVKDSSNARDARMNFSSLLN